MVHQYRKRQHNPEVRDAYYCPERDLAHIGIPLLRAGLIALEPRFWEPWFTKFLGENEVDDGDLAVAAQTLVQAIGTVIDTKDPPTAMEEVGFDRLRPEMQVAVYAKLGQVLLAAVWEGTKDVHAKGSAPPLSIEDLCEAVDKVLLREKKSLWSKIGSVISTLCGRFRTTTSQST